MKSFRLLLFLFFWGILLNVISAQITDQNQPIPPDPSIITGKFENGMTYYIKQNKKPEHRIVFRLAIDAGSVCETNAQQGLAHFCEHMCFNGTKNFPSNKMVDTLEEMGVKFGDQVNAYTSFDETIYMLEIPTDSATWINRGFQVVEDWAHQVDFAAKEIDKERGVITEEWRLGLGADDRMQAKYIPVILKNSRYAERLPIGKIDIIKSFPYDTLRAFYKTWYRPDLMAVIVVGDIDPKLAEEKVREHFADIPEPAHPKKRIEYPVPDNTAPLISVVKDKEATGFDISIFYKHPKSEDITYADYRRSLKRSLYTGMLNSRLEEISQKPDAPFLYAGVGYGPFIGRAVDVYSVSAGAKENQMEKSLEVILREDQMVKQYGFTATELERQKKDILSRYENMAKESDKTESSSYADEFVRNFLTKECIPGIKKEYELANVYLPGITLDEVNSLGKQWITGTDMVVLITAQDKKGVEVPTEQKVLEIIDSAKTMKVTPYVDQVSDLPLLPVQPVPSKVVKRNDDNAFGYTELVFGNGVHMILKSTEFKNDEILMTAFSPGGTSLYPDKDIMSAYLAPNIVVHSGLGDFNYIELQKKLSGNTAQLSPYINELDEGVSGSCTPKDLETMLKLNYLYFTGVRKDENAFGALISRMKNMIEPLRTNPKAIFTDTLSKIVSMNSPRVIAIPTVAQIDQVSLDKSLSIFKDRFADASDFTYVMVGNFKIDSVIPLLEKYIGGLPDMHRKETWKDVTPGFPKGLVVVDVPKNSEPQSTVAMVWKGDFKWDPVDRESLYMLMDILTIKCRESMREDQGGVYGVSIEASVSKFPVPRYSITSYWGCSPANIEKLTQTLLDEMSKIMKDGPTTIDLNKVKETLLNERETQMKENSFWLAALENHFMLGEKLLSMAEYRAFIASITGKEIKDVADKYINTHSYVEVELTPAVKAEAR